MTEPLNQSVVHGVGVCRFCDASAVPDGCWGQPIEGEACLGCGAQVYELLGRPQSINLTTLHTTYQKVAIRWLMWDLGATEEEAKEILANWPDQGQASYAIDVATFIVEECHGS